jgi:hypothetical protein
MKKRKLLPGFTDFNGNRKLPSSFADVFATDWAIAIGSIIRRNFTVFVSRCCQLDDCRAAAKRNDVIFFAVLVFLAHGNNP